MAGQIRLFGRLSRWIRHRTPRDFSMKIAWIAFLLAASAGPAPGGPNLVVSKEAPALTLRIDRAFKALRPLRFPIEQATNAERRIFVEANRQRVVERMVIVQFEKVLPGSNFRFLYP